MLQRVTLSLSANAEALPATLELHRGTRTHTDVWRLRNIAKSIKHTIRVENHLERDVVVEEHVTIEAIINGDDLSEVPDI